MFFLNDFSLYTLVRVREVCYSRNTECIPGPCLGTCQSITELENT